MNGTRKDQTVLVVGRGGIARAVTVAARDAGAQVIAAGRDQLALAAGYAGEPGTSTETVDLTDEASIAALGERLGAVDHVLSTASARARGRLADLDRDAVRPSLRRPPSCPASRSARLKSSLSLPTPIQPNPSPPPAPGKGPPPWP
jgi:NADP-dependent 3-hydroxy acid dehydrogenase YdfG